MKSLNFEILRDGWPELAGLGAFAESYAHADPASALVKLRLFAENLTKDIYRELRLPKPDLPTFVDLLKNDAFIAITPKVVLDKLHALRMHGNKAAHGEPGRTQQALWLLNEAHDLARRMCVRYGQSKADQLPAFQQPAIPCQVEERERRQVLEKLAAQEAQMDALVRSSRRLARKHPLPRRKRLSSSSSQARDRQRPMSFNSVRLRPGRASSTAFWRASAGISQRAQKARRRSARRSRSTANPRPRASVTPTTCSGMITATLWPLWRRKRPLPMLNLVASRRSSMPMTSRSGMVTAPSSSTLTASISGFGTTLRTSRRESSMVSTQRTAFSTF